MTEQLANNARTTISSGLNTLTDPATFTVSSPSAFPTAGNFRLLVDSEILLVTTVAGSAFTARRAQEGTAASPHANGAAATLILTAGSMAQYVRERASVDVQDYAVGGYGTAGVGGNDTATVNAAIAAAIATGRRRIVFPWTTTGYQLDTIFVSVGPLEFVGEAGVTITQRTPTNYRIFFVTGNDVSFEGFSFHGGNSASTSGGAGIISFNTCVRSRVSRCHFTATGSQAIEALGTSETLVEHNTITACGRGIVCYNAGYGAHAYGNAILFNHITALNDAGGFGIFVAGDETARQIGYKIVGNYIDSPSIFQGIYAYHGLYDGAVIGNTANYAAQGIVVASGGGTNNVVAHNACRGNAQFGLQILGCQHVVVNGNAIDGRNAAGTPVAGTGLRIWEESAGLTSRVATVTGNILRGGNATSIGIHTYRAGAVTLSNNYVEGFFENVRVQDSEGVVITGGQCINPVGTAGQIISIVATGADHNGLIIQGVRMAGACFSAVRLSANAPYFINHPLISGNNTAGILAAAQGLVIDDPAQVVNLRVEGNHTGLPTDPQYGLGTEIRTIGGTYTVLDSDHTLLCVMGSTYGVSLPSAVNRAGRRYTFKRFPGTGTVTLYFGGVQTLDGATFYDLTVDYQFVAIQSDGTNWWIVAKG